ncbi:hypothetical protein CLIB1444_08S02586 [[Candida] jaroonii]|uniref:Uncharacterized protein n=1 Tax=[Candida] jaroonii TaxID=467808 RepID=A0ACA9YAN7_9ASCO|nr:hypothetical protein CLIB1444_08S02586 [[Candida] jaroonii]
MDLNNTPFLVDANNMASIYINYITDTIDEVVNRKFNTHDERIMEYYFTVSDLIYESSILEMSLSELLKKLKELYELQSGESEREIRKIESKLIFLVKSKNMIHFNSPEKIQYIEDLEEVLQDQFGKMAADKINMFFKKDRKEGIAIDEFFLLPTKVIELLVWANIQVISDIISYEMGTPRIEFIKATIKLYHASYDKETGHLQDCEPKSVYEIFENDNREASIWEEDAAHRLYLEQDSSFLQEVLMDGKWTFQTNSYDGQSFQGNAVTFDCQSSDESIYSYEFDASGSDTSETQSDLQGLEEDYEVPFDEPGLSYPAVSSSDIRLLTAISTEFNFQIQHLEISSSHFKASTHCVTERFGNDNPKFICVGKVLKELSYDYDSNTVGLFFKRVGQDVIYIALYVDDLFMAASNFDLITELMQALSKYLDLNYLGDIKQFLGIEFARTEEGYSMSQEKFLRKVLAEFNINDMPNSSVPAYNRNNYVCESNLKDQSLTRDQVQLYRSGVGALLWLARHTRPDISYAVNELDQNSNNPTHIDVNKLNLCFRYLKGSPDQRLNFTRSYSDLEIFAYADASYSPTRNRKLISGMVCYLNKNLIHWENRGHKFVTKNSSEAQLFALNKCVVKCKDLKSLLNTIDLRMRAVTINESKKQVIAHCLNPDIGHKSRLLDTYLKYIRQELEMDESLFLKHVSAKFNLAGLITRSFSNSELRSLIHLLSSPLTDHQDTAKNVQLLNYLVQGDSEINLW